jgi:hypothetical protein
LATTAVCIIALNVVLAQLIAHALVPAVGARLGPTSLAVLGVVALAGAAYVVRGWWRYLRRGPEA